MCLVGITRWPYLCGLISEQGFTYHSLPEWFGFIRDFTRRVPTKHGFIEYVPQIFLRKFKSRVVLAEIVIWEDIRVFEQKQIENPID